MSPLHRIIRQRGPHRIPLGPAKLYLDDIQGIVSTVEAFKVERNKKMAAHSDEVTESNDSEPARAQVPRSRCPSAASSPGTAR